MWLADSLARFAGRQLRRCRGGVAVDVEPRRRTARRVPARSNATADAAATSGMLVAPAPTSRPPEVVSAAVPVVGTAAVVVNGAP